MSTLDISQIMQHLPHRYPFLLVDRVLECEAGKSLLAVKNVSYNEPYFTGHFPQRPVMPGVLIVEALAQATGILAFVTENRQPEDNSIYLLVGIDKARFRRPVEPGDRLMLAVAYERKSKGMHIFSAEARVDDKVVASAEIMCTARNVES